MDKYRFVKNIYSKEIGDKIKGFLSAEIIKRLKEDEYAINGDVLIGMEYRPDKISAYYYGSIEYAWIIVAVNTTKGIEDLTLGKKLILPSVNTINMLGVNNAI